MPEYEVWTSNDVQEWAVCHLETDSREEAKAKAQALVDSGRFRPVAIDRRGKTLWSNDPDIPGGTE